MRIRINIGETVSELSLFLYKYVCVFIYIYIYIYKLVKGISIAYKVDKFQYFCFSNNLTNKYSFILLSIPYSVLTIQYYPNQNQHLFRFFFFFLAFILFIPAGFIPISISLSGFPFFLLSTRFTWWVFLLTPYQSSETDLITFVRSLISLIFKPLLCFFLHYDSPPLNHF